MTPTEITEKLKTHPVNNGRYICGKNHPMPLGAIGMWEHPDAVEVDGTCDCCATYKCPNCNFKFKEELPQ